MGSPITHPRCVQRIVWGACLLFGLCMPVAAQVDESPLLDHIDQKMIDIGAQLANARKRLSMSDGVVRENANGESGMGLTCCTDNLRTIAEKIRNIRVSVERMAAYYVEHENGEAVGLLGELDARLQAINTGAIIFARAPDEKNASAALTGFIRPWNEFRNAVQSLRLCCPIPIPVEPESADAPAEEESGKKKKKSKKNKKKENKKKTEQDPDAGESPES